jgi:hypothetical protein
MIVSRWWMLARRVLCGLLLVAGCSRTSRGGAVPRTYAEAVAEVGALTGTKGHAGESSMGEPLDGVLLFETKSGAGLELVLRNQARLRPAGAYLFLFQRGYGVRTEVIGIAPTTDKFDLVRRVQTDAANYGHDNAAVIAWLRELDRDDPLDLVGAGPDFVEGAFRAPVKDRVRLAQRIHSFCPDFVEQGIGLGEEGDPHALIQRYFASNLDFFFWWD